MVDPAATTAVPELNGKNWRQWFIRMENYLRIHNMWNVTQEELMLEKQENGEIKLEDSAIYYKMQQARCSIMNCVNEEYSGHITTCTTAHQVWTTLKELYQHTGLLSEGELEEKLAKTRKRSDQSVDQYMNNIVQVVDELRQINIDLPEEEVCHHVLDGLPDNYHMVVLTLKHYHQKLTMARVRESLAYEEAYLKKGRAYLTQEPKGKAPSGIPKIKCQYCKKVGYTVEECRFYKAAHPRKDRVNEINQTKRTERPMSLVANTAKIQGKNNETWIIDSGASWHMTGDQSFLETDTIREHSGQIEIANRTLLAAKSMGIVRLTLKDDQQTRIELLNVVYVPGLSANPISVTCMTNNGASVRFDKGTCIISQGKNTIKASLTENSNYCFHATADIWHQRLGHIHSSRIKKLGLPHKMAENCNACVENKQTATKFKPKDYQYEPLDLVYMNVVGPIHPETPDGHRYYMSALDHATKTCLVYLMPTKGLTGKYARRAINVLEQKAKGDKRVRAIRTDLGQEFLGRKLADFLSERGIEHEKTAGYAPQQNDAERLHRDIREHASTMLNASNLPQKYWGAAVRAYAYTRSDYPPLMERKLNHP